MKPAIVGVLSVLSSMNKLNCTFLHAVDAVMCHTLVVSEVQGLVLYSRNMNATRTRCAGDMSVPAGCQHKHFRF